MTTPPDDDGQGAITSIYCNRCDRTYYYAAHGNTELFDRARDDDPEAQAELVRIRLDLLETHKMECAA